ncbi:MAG TPA: PQQ-binding-like beta-propeller repeat protein, partial [Gemmataceae bacterium]|nr:PQQ-binding-like beta-propeller repeat protein [Gemmataceae bacterium]
KGLPVTWDAKTNIAWKTELPGPGSSSPIVVGKKVFVSSYSGYGLSTKEPGDIQNLKRHLVCIDRDTGNVIWTKDIPAAQPESPYKSFQVYHGYASSTPASDGTSVFVFFGKSGVFAFDLDGNQLWHADVGTTAFRDGTAASPVLYKDRLFVNAGIESGTLYALDKKTGKEVWRASGISETGKETWSTPALVKVPGGGTELVVSGAKKVLGFDPDTGAELWRAEVFTWYVCPTVVAHDGVVYALQSDTCAAVRAGGRGDVTRSHVLWQTKFGAVVTSPVYHDGHLYWATGSMVACVKASDGTEVYKERLTPDPKSVYASPVAADGKLYFVSRTEGAFVVELAPEFKQLAHNSLAPDTSIFNGSPAVSHSQLLLRSDRYLYCIGKAR